MYDLVEGVVGLDKLSESNEGCESAKPKWGLELDELAESNLEYGA